MPGTTAIAALVTGRALAAEGRETKTVPTPARVEPETTVAPQPSRRARGEGLAFWSWARRAT